MLTYEVYDVSVYGEQQGDTTLVAAFAYLEHANRYVNQNARAHNCMRLVNAMTGEYTEFCFGVIRHGVNPGFDVQY